MTKTKAQLRAEAVERLRKIRDARYPICNSDIGAAIANGNIDNAIDLLTDDEPQDVTTPEFDVPLYGWHEGDTREKLEADVRTYMFPWRVDMALDWLDRQAAITRMEDECACHDCTMEQVEALQEKVDALDELRINACLKRDKLKTKVDELEAENARLRSRMSDDAEYGRLVMGAYRELRAKLDEIAKVVDA